MPNPRIAIAQIRPKKADYPENLSRIGAVFAQLAGEETPPNVVVFPEAVTSGYFLEGGVRTAAVTAESLFRDLAAQHSLSGAPSLDVVAGFYERYRSRYHNSAIYAALGGASPGILHVHRKIFLPTYGVFDEKRFLEPAHSVEAFDTQWGRAGMLICEDIWHSLTPTLAVLDGADFLFVPSASPARGVTPARVLAGTGEDETIPASIERWERLVRNIACEHGVYVALAQLVGFEGGKGFPGASMIVGPDGDLLARGPLFEEAIVVSRFDHQEILRARADQPLLADLKSEIRNLLSPMMDGEQEADDGELGQAMDESSTPVPGLATPTATAPHATKHLIYRDREKTDPLTIDAELVMRWLVAFLEEEVVVRRGFQKGLVGLSGGADSSVTASLAARALGAENVIGVRMPYATSSKESFEDAELVASELGIRLETVDISAAVDGLANVVGPKLDPRRLGNVMARMRMVTLFDLSAAHHALPLGTGNKTERLLGYFTWHADDSPPVNPLGDLFKSQVWSLARYLGVPERIVSKPASADLIKGQTDEGDLGISYPRADLILYFLLRGLEPDEITSMGDINAEDVELVRGRLDSTHWKRRLPTVAMVSQTAIGEYYLRPVDY
jgi:NAD+ synthetase